MKRMSETLGLRRGACIPFIGGGGKTTSILALAEFAVALGLTVTVTTTTKIWSPPGLPLVLQANQEDLVGAVRLCLSRSPIVAVGNALTDSGKVLGLKPQFICRLFYSMVTDVVLCEADGAAGRSLKVHAIHEPVVPNCATSVAVVGGMDAIGQCPGPAVIHRFEQYVASVDEIPPLAVSSTMFADILLLTSRRLGTDAPVVFILNKADEPNTRRKARRVAAEIRTRVPHAAIVITSHRSFIERTAARSGLGSSERGVNVAP